MYDPRDHLNAEADASPLVTGTGFAVAFGICFLMVAAATVVSIL